MKMVHVVLLIVLLAAAAHAVQQGFIIAGVVQNGPAINTVLVDSGALDPMAHGASETCLTGGKYGVGVHISSQVGTFFKILVLDSLGAAVGNPIFRGVPANDSKDFQPGSTFSVPNNGKIQVQNVFALTTGQQVQATLSITELVNCY